ncbi:sensor histidine kinase [Salipiger mucosus]|uniref:histidine kinase n=1 Tax=Salipiger mucosus DSM 16094 TaxID=1123237 RepID=S9RQR1_9RHOB|nr:ATP-binding protein [Salipiger mucosus]EPX80400.1 hypothetical protein Salmuc_03716 [Salipiger mucosus DSM 16094]
MADGLRPVPSALSEARGQYDFRPLKQVEAVHPRDTGWRFGLLAVISVMVFFAYGDPTLLWWFAVFLASSGLHFAVVHNLPDHGSYRLLALPLGSLMLSGCVYLFAGLYLWASPDVVFKLMSLFLLVVTGLNALVRRSHHRPLLLADMGLIAVGIGARISILWLEAPWQTDTLALSTVLVVVGAYFLQVALDVAAMRARLDIARRTEAARERQKAMSQFTGGVAHDFNNLLTAVLGNVELARLSEAPGERDELMDEAERAARRGAELTGRLLVLSSVARLSPEPVRSEQLLASLDGAARSMLPAGGARLAIDAPAELPQVCVDPGRFETAMLELVGNAAAAMPPEGGEIVIHCRESTSRGVRYVRFEVRDTGRGIAPEIQARVFDPYFTTHPVGQGSGLGLATVRGFVEQSGGRIELDSAPGQGTTLRIDLPVFAQA